MECSTPICELWEFWQANHQGVRNLVFSLAGLLGAFGIWLAYRRTKAADLQAAAATRNAEASLENSKAALQQATLAGSRLDTDRFSKAIEQLGHDRRAVRLGAIYALEQIAKDNPDEYHWPIMETLTAFVRQGDSEVQSADHEGKTGKGEKAPIPEQALVGADIAAAVAVLARRDAANDPPDRFLDLSGAHLKGLSLANVDPRDLRNVRLNSADLRGADLRGADLRGARLWGANLEAANLEGADLQAANLQGANLQAANLQAANLEEANLQMANLEAANLEGANLQVANLQAANLEEANLEEANLEEANLRAANLEEAELRGAELRGAKVHASQLVIARNPLEAKLDAELQAELKKRLHNNDEAVD